MTEIRDVRDRLKRKQEFIRALAEYLAGDQARRSIQLQMNNPWAVEWAKLRGLSPVFGYPTVDEAEEALIELLG